MNFHAYEQTNTGVTSTGIVVVDSFDAAMAIARERRTNASMSFGVVPEGQPLPDAELRNAIHNPFTPSDYKTVCAVMRKRGVNLRKRRGLMMVSGASKRKAIERRIGVVETK